MRTTFSLLLVALLAATTASAQEPREAESADRPLRESMVVAPIFESATPTVTPESSRRTQTLLAPPLLHSTREDNLLPLPVPAPASSGSKAVLAIVIPLVVIGIIALALAIWPQGP